MVDQFHPCRLGWAYKGSRIAPKGQEDWNPLLEAHVDDRLDWKWQMRSTQQYTDPERLFGERSQAPNLLAQH
ncbi:hypothetical protein, partial [Bradyrhizobium sp. 154]|uniref:hypothetical protein n=1 Tax=Bradyrhizobium sp. 154 TaxID=2782628 RepID=UPI001FF711B5